MSRAVNNWLRTPFIKHDPAQTLHIEINFIMRKCLNNLPHCKETFNLYYYEADSDIAKQEVPSWDSTTYKLIDKISGDYIYTSEIKINSETRQIDQRPELVGVYFAFQDEGACLTFYSIKIYDMPPPTETAEADVGIIIAIVIVVLVLIVAAAAVAWYCWRRKKRVKNSEETDVDNSKRKEMGSIPEGTHLDNSTRKQQGRRLSRESHSSHSSHSSHRSRKEMDSIPEDTSLDNSTRKEMGSIPEETSLDNSSRTKKGRRLSRESHSSHSSHASRKKHDRRMSKESHSSNSIRKGNLE
ncbi:ephrin type-B receptor 3-like [Gigantopelta aegis]|uniref:ephrin type-B receptor 3-like n=1 Tax=Gigantopelta aegis TaxID=1735272 RepID=UPI001B88CC05|nr:ephrin type-B receptor 3-like [Gigantopelta aegis]